VNILYVKKNVQSNLPMQSPLLSSHLYLNVTLFLSFHRSFHISETLLRGHLSCKVIFSLSQRWSLNTRLTVCVNHRYCKNNHMRLLILMHQANKFEFSVGNRISLSFDFWSKKLSCNHIIMKIKLPHCWNSSKI